MSKLRRNIVANFIGKGWTALMAFAFVPLYIKFMGIEAYGLVGFYTTLQAVFFLLDMGLSTTLNRELARLSAQEGKAQEARDLVRTLEIIYWAIAGVIALLVVILSPLLATHWIKSQQLSADSIHVAVLLMGLAIACKFPFFLYSGGLLGLQRQVLLNGIAVSMATFLNGGVILILWLVSPTIQAFFFWQALISLLQTLLSAIYLWQSLPKIATKPQFQQTLLRNIWRFAASMTGISILAVLLTQLDKIILSQMLSLETFGYYSLATTVASGLYVIVNPIFTAIFPRFSQLVSQGSEKNLISLYHQSCQLMSVLVLPIAIVVCLFSKEILWLWTGNHLIVENAYLLVSLLIAGTALNALMNIPYALQLAYGWTKLALYSNIVAILLLVPFLFLLSNYYGAMGAAAVWVILNSGYVLFCIQLMHRRLLKSEKLRWYFQDIGLSLLGALTVTLVGRLLFPAQTSIAIQLVSLVLVLGLALVTAALLTPVTNNWIRKIYSTQFI